MPSFRRSAQPHLELRPTGYYWRRRWPRPPRATLAGKKFQNRFLVFALRTNLPVEARDLGARLSRITDGVFALTETTMTLAPDHAETILTELIRFEIAAFEQSRAVAPLRSAELAAADRARELAVVETLRDALWLRDREAARHPLRAAAARLGLPLDEADPSWAALAMRATQALIDTVEECLRRERGHYHDPSPLFRAAIRPVTIAAPTVATMPCATPARVSSRELAGRFGGMSAPPAAGAHAMSCQEISPMLEAPAPEPAMPPAGPPNTVAHPAPAPLQQVPAPAAATTPSLIAAVPETVPPAIRTHRTRPIPYPEGETAANCKPVAEHAVDWRRFPDKKQHVSLRLLSPRSFNALTGDHPITLSEAWDLNVELKLLGFNDHFDKRQKPIDGQGEKWRKSSLGGRMVAGRIWLDILGDIELDDLEEWRVEAALKTIGAIPNVHGKTSSAWKPFTTYSALVAEAEEREIAAKSEAERSITGNRDLTEAQRIEKINATRIPRLAVDTYLKHVRAGGGVGRMLQGLGRLDLNPFSPCSYTSVDEAKLRANEGGKVRMAWDDRIYEFFRSAKFQTELEDVGDPLFWAPILARTMGFRSEEVLQIAPGDFSTSNGITTIQVHDAGENNVKSSTSKRTIPVPPAVIELGPLKLVAQRRRENSPKLFPHLRRGMTKETYTELFTKAFGYYRKTHEVYWPGLDFHALRTAFHQDLMDGSTPGALRRRLMGHTPLDEGERSYTDGISNATLLEHVCKIQVDLSMIRSPFVPSDDTKVIQFAGMRR